MTQSQAATAAPQIAPAGLAPRYTLLGASMLFFVVSGFAALIYQSVWSTYLGLILGHAAYAQALVLSIFMGGMAIGSWLASRVNVAPARLILAYGAIEFVIGLLGLFFHREYLWLADFSLNQVLPHTSSATAALFWQWSSGAMLVLPQSILLGMTFPILGAACVFGHKTSDSSVLGSLYFANSIGAAFGALVATFLLMPSVGSPGTLRVAGLLNLVIGVAAIAYALSIARTPVASEPASANATAPVAAAGASRLLLMMLVAAGITGATSFVYEIGWVRLLGLAMGSTQHTFELMLSAFIMGLALGGLAVRRFSRSGLADTVFIAGLAQVAMGVVTLLSLIVFARSFEFVQWLIAATRPGAQGYSLFLLGSASLSLVTVLPAAFFAGMTLPLMTAAVLEAGLGSDKIGKVYAANTLGAIVGVFLMVHVLIPLIGVRLSLALAALIDVFLGVVLIRMYSRKPHRMAYLISLLLAVLALGLAQTVGRVGPEKLASGVFRSGVASLPGNQAMVSYLHDGKTASVSLLDLSDGTRSIATNGKVDAAIQLHDDRPRTADEATMRMLASVPLSSRAHFGKVAVIGFGSGMSTHTLLGSDQVGSVDTIEIEAEMVRAARGFGVHNERAYTDPRSHIVINDARTHFASGNKHYDLIVAEPSNPWVSGVASLFTTEFYDEARRHLNPNGMMVQWVQAYELSDQLLATMVAAMLDQFHYVDAYLTNTSDLVLVGRQESDAFPKTYDHLSGAALLKELDQNALVAKESYVVRWLGGTEAMTAYIRMLNAKPHSDFFPVVSLHAPEARFSQVSATILLNLVDMPLPVQQMANGRPEVESIEGLGMGTNYGPGVRTAVDTHLLATSIGAVLRSGTLDGSPLINNQDAYFRLTKLFSLSTECRSGGELREWIDALIDIAGATLPFLPPSQSAGLFERGAWMHCQQPDSEQEHWLQLMQAIGRRDAPEMERLALLLGAKDSVASMGARRYLAVTMMLARLAQGNNAGVETAESELGVDIDASSSLLPTRGFLLALSDLREQAAATE